jgi:hypothetical protein
VGTDPARHPGNAAYFIAAHALEVSIPGHKVLLARGGSVSGITLLTWLPYQSGVGVISYYFLVSGIRAFLA